jgi:hypothetical protein
MARTPAEQDLTIYKGDDFYQLFVFTDSAGSAIDFTSWSAKAQIRKKKQRSSELIAEFTASFESRLEGKISIALTDSVTASMEPSEGYWDMLLTDDVGFDERYLYGKCALEETVTVK